MQKNKQRPGVMLYFHLLRPMKCLSKEQFADLVWALLDYAEMGVLPVFEEPMMQMGWSYLQHAADVDLERYEERLAQTRAASAKRWGKDTSASERMQTVANSNTEPDTNPNSNIKADADAHTKASASAKTQTKKQASQPFEVPRKEGEDFEAWRERQIEAITRYNQSLQGKAKTQTAS